MATAQHTVSIDCDVDKVFDFLADGTNNPRWRTGVIEISTTDPTPAAGTTYRQVMAGPGGRRIDGDYRIVTFDRPHRLTFEVTAGPLRPTGEFNLSPGQNGHTEVTFQLDAQPRGFMRLMGPMVKSQMRKEVAALDALKVCLEEPS
jgi:carbon monoxide dehydrogenase subunit G